MVDEEEVEHTRSITGFNYCGGCGKSWPCEVARLQTEVERSRVPVIDWKRAAVLLRKRYRIKTDWLRQGWADWRSAAVYWMRRANTAERRVRELEAVSKSSSTQDAS